MKTPKWFLKRNLISYILYPLSLFYYMGSKTVFYLRKKHEYISKRPVICFGNILSGGVGKTPLVRNVAKFFNSPVVMRGYKRNKKIFDIGDEAKMLSNDGIQVHVGNRLSNLILLNKQKSKLPIIMDDGFQNSSIKKDISVLVFDESIGFGNGFLLPAGPLRELQSALKRADAIIIIKRKNKVQDLLFSDEIPVFYAKNTENCPYGKNVSVVAFAGIGYPEKFFDNIPSDIVLKKSFPDHYQYTDKDIQDLIKIANEKNAELLTTEKDWVRLPDWAKKQIKFSELNIEIESKFYDWIKERLDDISNKKS